MLPFRSLTRDSGLGVSSIFHQINLKGVWFWVIGSSVRRQCQVKVDNPQTRETKILKSLVFILIISFQMSKPKLAGYNLVPFSKVINVMKCLANQEKTKKPLALDHQLARVY